MFAGLWVRTPGWIWDNTTIICIDYDTDNRNKVKHMNKAQFWAPKGITGFGLSKIPSQHTLRASTELLTYYRALVTPAHLQPRFLFFSFLLHKLIFRGLHSDPCAAMQPKISAFKLILFPPQPPFSSKTTKITLPGGSQALPLPTLCFSRRKKSLQSTCSGSAQPIPPDGVGKVSVVLISTELPSLGTILLDEWLETWGGSEGVQSCRLRLAGISSGGPSSGEFWASVPLGFGDLWVFSAGANIWKLSWVPCSWNLWLNVLISCQSR